MYDGSGPVSDDRERISFVRVSTASRQGNAIGVLEEATPRSHVEESWILRIRGVNIDLESVTQDAWWCTLRSMPIRADKLPGSNRRSGPISDFLSQE